MHAQRKLVFSITGVSIVLFFSPVQVRVFNDAMMQLERVFIDPLGLPGRKYTR